MNKLLVVIGLLSIPILIYGCGSGSTEKKPPQNNLDISFALPSELSQPNIPDLHAELTINDSDNDSDNNNEPPMTLSVDTANKTASGQMNNVESGESEYSFTVTYYVIRDGTKIVLATGNINSNIASGKDNDVQFANLNRNIDSDNDGFTNLAEVRIGKNPLDSNDRPSSTLARSSANAKYTVVDSLGDKQVTAGKINSQNGRYAVVVQ